MLHDSNVVSQETLTRIFVSQVTFLTRKLNTIHLAHVDDGEEMGELHKKACHPSNNSNLLYVKCTIFTSTPFPFGQRK